MSYTYYEEELENSYYYPYNCNYGSNIYRGYGETIGENSICFESSLTPRRSNKYLEEYYSICYEIKCVKNEKKIIVYFGGSSFICPGYETVLYQPNGLHGQIKCPDYNMVCTSNIWCNELFDCIDKKSEADLDTYCTKVRKEMDGSRENKTNFLKLNIFSFFIKYIVFGFLYFYFIFYNL